MMDKDFNFSCRRQNLTEAGLQTSCTKVKAG